MGKAKQVKEKPLAMHRRFGFSIRVYPNRVEVRNLKFLFIHGREVIPMRNISHVERDVFSNRVVIHTSDGRRRRYVCGLATGKVYDAILGAL